MIKTKHLNLDEEQRSKLDSLLVIQKEIEEKGYLFVALFALIAIEFGILYWIYLLNEEGFAVVLKLLSIVPVWLTVTMTYLYFQRKNTAITLIKEIEPILTSGTFPTTEVRAKECDAFTENGVDYFLFSLESSEIMILRAQDFSFDTLSFPNSNFFIPPQKLLKELGRDIISIGEKLKVNSKKVDETEYYHLQMSPLEAGSIIIL